MNDKQRAAAMLKSFDKAVDKAGDTALFNTSSKPAHKPYDQLALDHIEDRLTKETTAANDIEIQLEILVKRYNEIARSIAAYTAARRMLLEGAPDRLTLKRGGKRKDLQSTIGIVKFDLNADGNPEESSNA